MFRRLVVVAVDHLTHLALDDHARALKAREACYVQCRVLRELARLEQGIGLSMEAALAVTVNLHTTHVEAVRLPVRRPVVAQTDYVTVVG